MRIKFLCPHCERVCRVPAALAGKQGRCPGCRKGLEVPVASTLASERRPETAPSAQSAAPPAADALPSALDPAEEATDPEEAAPARSGLPWQLYLAFAFCLLLPLPGLLFAGWGLSVARRRERHERAAWAAVVLNAANLVFNILFLLSRGLRS
ncbi:MAG: hypothetical protein D6731_21325 [Planctomycetota bacterium]|nr:MAG: hypothetical protein D6731_21325 [Planctomycetota bacterium]